MSSNTRPLLPKTSGSDFARLSRKITDAGLLERRPGYYALRITGVAALYVSGWAAVALIGDSWWTLAVAAFLAVVFGQVALLAHDAAHRQVFRRRRASEASGRIAGAGVGMSYGWWQDKHTRHHANPNHEELDPDLDPDLLVWSQDQARAAKGLPRLIGRWQAFLFFPLLTLEGFNLHVSSVKALANRSLKHRTLDGALLFGHFALYLTVLLWLLPPGMAIAFLAVHQGLFGVYLGSLFAPNHKGMPILTGEDRPDFLRRQVLTSRNVRGGLFTDIALGGLNHQIEHHLFPSMPSPNLRKARPVVRRHCQELGLDYAETGLLTSYRLALASLHQAGAPLRHTNVAAQAPAAAIGGSDV
ncbi:fatty acid desaturase family protein [Streptomyces sp. NPDC001668]|uniref:fatty acid desaturase family protein n=1 Tax=unclassified Streptomyces TaxID=2593676 RepID=UPI0036AEDA05